MLTLPSHSVITDLRRRSSRSSAQASGHRLVRCLAICAQLATLGLSAAAPGMASAAPAAIGLAAQPAARPRTKAIADPEATGQITGAVFNDYNDDGYRNLISTPQFPALDAGVPGIAVAAYNSANTAVASTTTNANGLYTLTTNLPAGVPLRIEFTGYKMLNYESGVHGPNNNSSLRFVTTSDATITNIDFGIYKSFFPLSPLDLVFGFSSLDGV